MAKFLSKLIVEVYNGDGEYELVEPLIYQSDIAGEITIPKGFKTDFASVPKFLPITRSLLGDRGKRAAVVHDYYYRNGIGTRATADEIYKEALNATENSVVAYFMWLGVRLGGAFSWKGVREWATGVPCDERVES